VPLNIKHVLHEVLKGSHLVIHRVGQNRINTPYLTIYLTISLRKIPCIH